MRGIKSLLAVAILASAGAAQAATVAIFNVSETGSSSVGTTQLLTGTGTLDDSGTMTVNLSGTFDGTAVVYNGTTYNLGVANISTTSVYSGSLANGVFTVASGTAETNTCTNDPTLCGSVTLNSAGPLTTVSGTVSLASGGSLTGSIVGNSQALTATDTFTPVSAVPLPATAWLFCSGLFGLAGVARRRAKAA